MLNTNAIVLKLRKTTPDSSHLTRAHQRIYRILLATSNSPPPSRISSFQDVPETPRIPAIGITRPATWTKRIKSRRERMVPPSRCPPSPPSRPISGRKIIRIPRRKVQIPRRKVQEKRWKEGRWEERRRRIVADAQAGTAGGRPSRGVRRSVQKCIGRCVRLSAALGVHRSVHRGIDGTAAALKMTTRLDGRPGITNGPRLCVRAIVAIVVAVVMT